jgi:peptide chain release factor 2
MLLRMYMRWAEAHGYKVTLTEESAGEQAGLKSATIQVQRPNAYGWLKTESGRSPAGPHLALRRGGASADQLRQRATSTRWWTTGIEVEINPADLRPTPSAPPGPAAST